MVNGSLEIANGAFATFGNLAGGSGILNQSGGALTTVGTGRITIGQAGAGQYNMSGGTATLANGLMIGQFAGSTGTVTQTGGLVTIAGGVLTVGVAGVATYNLNGGLLQAGGTNGITGTGSLNLGGGALQVIGSALTANIAIGLTGTNSIVDTNGLGATLGGVMSGTGGFTKSGAGTLSLTGTNLYTGATTISEGTLQIGTGGTTGSIVGNVVDNAALVFNRSNASAFAGAISGTGSVTKMGAGNPDTLGRRHLCRSNFRQCGHASGRRRKCLLTKQLLYDRKRRDARLERIRQCHRLACRVGQCRAGIGDAHQRQ